MATTRIATKNKLRIKKVAGYVRVTSPRDEMQNSLANQISHYNEMIGRKVDWQFAGIFIDSGKTGTKSNRRGFQDMLEDCRNGKIDMIITKAVTRFARNMIDTIRITRELRSIGVDVYFEEQNLHSIDPANDYILTLWSYVAELEVINTSNNMKWRIDHDFKRGLSWGLKPCLGYLVENRNYVLFEKEAKFVRLIFDMYINGYGDQKITKLINATGYRTKAGKKWGISSINGILRNPSYMGTLVLQKTYREDPLTKRKRVNNGKLPKYVVENNHEAIIDKETFELAQQIRSERAKKHFDRTRGKKHIMSGLIKCSKCGKNYNYKVRGKKGKWTCETFYRKGKDECPSKQVLHTRLLESIRNLLNNQNIDEKNIRNHIKEILVFDNNKLLVTLKNGNQVETKWENDKRSESWTQEMRELAREKALRYLGGLR